ncbi:hypothetical protein TSAR_008320 [Trichomalopsis sarcophagae]|uniref:Uncharacterized protein n=1 Tax=Trichomalopsis sarcophagae TaxID=543379 RepID=A0A232FCZ7_9HYME|nr:hypothetical protein TSAR_008320 [Trichomalopsis sarcophagae]
MINPLRTPWFKWVTPESRLLIPAPRKLFQRLIFKKVCDNHSHAPLNPNFSRIVKNASTFHSFSKIIMAPRRSPLEPQKHGLNRGPRKIASFRGNRSLIRCTVK